MPLISVGIFLWELGSRPKLIAYATLMVIERVDLRMILHRVCMKNDIAGNDIEKEAMRSLPTSDQGSEAHLDIAGANGPQI